MKRDINIFTKVYPVLRLDIFHFQFFFCSVIFFGGGYFEPFISAHQAERQTDLQSTQVVASP